MLNARVFIIAFSVAVCVIVGYDFYFDPLLSPSLSRQSGSGVPAMAFGELPAGAPPGAVACPGTSTGYCMGTTHMCCGSGVCCPKTTQPDPQNLGGTQTCGACGSSFGVKFCTVNCCPAGSSICAGTGFASGKKICCPTGKVCLHGPNGVPYCGSDTDDVPNDLPNCGDGPATQPCLCDTDTDELSPYGPGQVVCQPGEGCNPTHQDYPGYEYCYPSSCSAGQTLCSGTGDFAGVTACCLAGQSCILDSGGFPKCQGAAACAMGPDGKVPEFCIELDKQ